MFSIGIWIISIAIGLLILIGLIQMIVDYFEDPLADLKKDLEEEQAKNVKIKEKLIKNYLYF